VKKYRLTGQEKANVLFVVVHVKDVEYFRSDYDEMPIQATGKQETSSNIKRFSLCHSMRGIIVGLAVLIISSVNLALFFGLHDNSEVRIYVYRKPLHKKTDVKYWAQSYENFRCLFRR
jgi:hypothetical protein